MTLRLSYVLPVHNQEAVLAASVRHLTTQLAEFPGSEVLLIENGSVDSSSAMCAELAASTAGGEVPVRVSTSPQGLGYALRRGIELAAGDLVVLTASDLPFGFTDLEAYLATEPRPLLAIGSKAHPLSRTRIPQARRAMSEAFRLLRRAVLGLRVGDSQGTILLDAGLARRLLPHLRCGDFLISTEIVSWAVQLGIRPVELPITYVAAGSSTVSPVRDSLRMARGLWSLRHRLHTTPDASR